MLSGDVVLETEAGEQMLHPGMCAGFPAGAADGHRFVNRGEGDVLLLVVVGPHEGDEVDTRTSTCGAHGAGRRYHFTRKDGTPFA